MTPKQQRFVEEYLIDLNATQAAIRAGYSEKTASDIGRQQLGKTPVRSAIDEALRKRSEDRGLTADWVLDHLRENVTLAKEAGQYGPSNKALELLGKHMGILVERQQIEGSLAINIGTGVPG
jgi:phage terminase small subunit